jgi:thiol-disulfide isomerase/thioredoxin
MKRAALALVGVLVLGACSAAPRSGAATSAPATSTTTPGSSPSPPASASEAPTSSATAQDPLLTAELVDVRTGESFTLATLAASEPVLLETMAIWCTTCLHQQREVVQAHAVADFISVGIDVDPNERAADLAAYAEREGFDWRFVMADTALVALLTDRFGFGVTHPPSTPTFVVTADGIRALEFGHVRSATELIAELDAS